MKRADRLSTSLIIFPSPCGANTHEIEETVEMCSIRLSPSGEAALLA